MNRSEFHDKCVLTPDYYATWTYNNLCETTLRENIYNQNGTINLEGMNWAQGEMQTVISNTLSTIQPIGSADPFQGYLYNICMEMPQACELGLNSVCSKYTRDSTATNSLIVDFCGCHMTSSTYAKYNAYSLGKECDPLCARQLTIPYVLPNGIVKTCANTICIIDGITLDLTNSSVGDINFYQACGACTGAEFCKCTITDVSIQQVESELGDINLGEYCTGSLSCYRQTETGSAIEVDCSTNEAIEEETDNTILWIMLGIFLFIVIVLGLALVFGVLFKK